MFALRIPFLLIAILLMTSAIHAQDKVLADFESDTWGEWEVEGDAFGTGPVAADKFHITGYLGNRIADSFGPGDTATGSITSPKFELSHKYLSFLIAGGRHEGETGIELLIDGKPVRSATGSDSGQLNWQTWDVADLHHKTARLRLFDRARGDWGHITVDHILLTDQPRRSAGTWRLEEYRRSPAYYQERFRPAFHFTPELNWMNDPNGLVFFDGEYHLFYQHNPHGNEWGHMSWGHAVSRDLMHWQHLPIAIQEEYGVMAFSGSAVVDTNNTSGFGTAAAPPLVAIYTGHGPDRQTQDLAYSNDRGRTWTRYSHNPVLDLGEKDFRDPKVFWHAPTSRWVMVVSLALKKRIQFYGSKDLKQWSLLSEFGPAGVASKINWECPDLFELPIEDDAGKTRWVLETDMGSGSVAGGSGGEYFTGMFDGQKFVADSTESQWVDYGRDFYAPVSWSNIPKQDGRRIWIGWMNNWETCLNPTSPWRSAMSVPRELTLRRIDGGLRLCQTPVRELKLLHEAHSIVKDRVLDSGVIPLESRGQRHDIRVEFEPGTATDFGLHLLKNGEQQTVVGYDAKATSLYVDRTKSGNVSFHAAFSGRHAGPLKPDRNGRIRIQVLVDACSVEVFGNDGETVITELVFPDADSVSMELFSTAGRCKVISCDVIALKSAIRAGQIADH